MTSHHPLVASVLALLLCSLLPAQVLVSDSGMQTITIGPGAPAHTVGLEGVRQLITLDTGKRAYGLRYGVARDAKRPGVAIPGEGYIGMPQPVDCNWYAGGFFDLQLNGQSIGGTPIHSLTGRSSGDRGTADFVFDTPLALVRIRFVALAGGDCLYTQLLLEPRQTLTSVRVVTRCYPSAYVSDSDRHVCTPTRDLKQGQRAELDLAREWWTFYYDSLYDAGYVGTTQKGAGPCAMLWLPEQTVKAGFSVGSYGTDTTFDLQPTLRDFRFIFFDDAGVKNEAARADLQARGPALRQELAAFAFTDPVLTAWPLAQKQADVQRFLALVPDDREAAARYQGWGEELTKLLALVQEGPAGAIMAEANAARIISEWERGLPMLRLKALLNRI